MCAYGDPRLPDRFWAKTAMNAETGCWEWTGAGLASGYGQFGDRSLPCRTVLTHRHAYETLVGPIPEGLQIDHLCRNRGCCNPAHLEAVTARENTRRGAPANKTHCKNGHEFTPENTAYHVAPKWGRVGRRCRACDRERHRARAAAQARDAA